MESRTITPRKTNRLQSLDGLRGIAALIVFFHHVLVLVYGRVAGINEHAWPVRPKIALTLLQNAPVGWVFNGAFAVSFFFVLSGFVLTRAMGEKPPAQKIAQLVTVRFLRLFPLVLLGTVAGYLVFNQSVINLDNLRWLSGTDSRAYIAPELLARHGVIDVLKQALLKIWQGSNSSHLFDPPLWSIGIELQGSLLVYLLAGAFAETPNKRAKYIVGIAIGLCLIGPSCLSFLSGMYMAERSRSRDDVLLPVSQPWLVLLSGIALIWASVHPWDRNLWLHLPFSPGELGDTAISTLCAVFIMAAGLQLPLFRSFLSSRLIQYLGHCSYGMYVVHVPLLYMGVSPLLAALSPHVGFNLAAVVTTFLLLLVSLLLGSFVITRIDTPVARFSKGLVNRWLLGIGSA